MKKCFFVSGPTTNKKNFLYACLPLPGTVFHLFRGIPMYTLFMFGGGAEYNFARGTIIVRRLEATIFVLIGLIKIVITYFNH